jgi:hypothetical protein
MYKLVFTALSLLFFSQSQAENVVVDIKNFKESFTTNVPVSGRVLSGIALTNSASSSFSFMLPKSSEGKTLCFRVSSQDGTYTSENEYSISSVLNQGFSSANYPSEYRSKIQSFTAGELSLLATPGKCKSKAVNQVYLSARGLTDLNDEVTIFVSSGRSDVYLRVPKNKAKKETLKCRRIENGVRTAYDTLCKVPLIKLTAGINELSLVRRKSGRTLPSINFEVVLD